VERGGRLISQVYSGDGEHGFGAGRVAEDEVLVAEEQLVAIIEDDGNADTASIYEGTVAAPQVDQGEISGIAPLNQGMEARDRTAVEHDSTAIASADRPRLSLAEGKAAAAGFHCQERIKSRWSH
jgi:hypothetical protein